MSGIRFDEIDPERSLERCSRGCPRIGRGVPAPCSRVAGIDVDEVVTPVESHAAGVKRIGKISDRSLGHSADLDVSRHAAHMQALFCNASAVASQKRVAERTPVGGYEADLARVKVILYRIEYLDERRIDLVFFAGQPAAEEVRDLMHRL